MKTKRSKKRSNIPANKRLQKIGPASVRAASAELSSSPPTAMSMPPPDVLFREAEQEPDFRSLSAYVQSIQVLRKKGFSYRDIADWLSERGVEVDHNAVYRVYTNSLSDYDARLEDLREAEEEARRNS